MILFHLICGQNHEFEGWFPSGDAYDRQVKAGEVSCPLCNDHIVRKAPMAPGVLKGGSKAGGEAGTLREALVELRRKVEESFDDVGDRFPEEARRIHYGEVVERQIYGRATLDEAKALTEEGVEIMLIPKRLRQDS